MTGDRSEDGESTKLRIYIYYVIRISVSSNHSGTRRAYSTFYGGRSGVRSHGSAVVTGFFD